MTVVENSLWQLLDQGVGRGLLFLFYACIPLLIGPDAYGSFAFVQAAMLVLVDPLMSLGLDLVVVREVARGSHMVVRPALFIRAVLIAATGLLAVAAGVMTHANTGVIVCLWVYLGLLSVERLVFSYYRGIQWMKMEGIVGVLQKALALPILGLLTVLGVSGAVLPAASLALMACIGAAIMGSLYRRRLLELFKRMRRSSDRPGPVPLLREGVVLGLAALASVVYFRIDSIMLGILADEKAVGMYCAAYRFMEATFIVPAMLTSAIFPRLAKATGSSATLRMAALGLAALASIATVVTYVAAAPLIGALYGTAYVRAGRTLEVLAFTIAPVYVGFLLTQAMIAFEQQNAYLRLTAMGVALNVALNLLLIPGHREVGAAIATLATEVAVVVTAAIWLRRPL